jgi:HSP20 family protein
MQRMTEDMDCLFEQFGFPRMGITSSFSPALDRDVQRSSSTGGANAALWSPQVEVRKRDDKLVIRADLPGVKKEDLHVDVEDDVLVLSGERRDEHEESRDGYYRSERSYGEFYRAIPLPEGVSTEQVDATFKDGVLEVAIPAPKQEDRAPKRIPIR